MRLLTWHDEFDGLAGSPPDPARWDHDIGGHGWGDNEWQYYTDSAGALVITATTTPTATRALAQDERITGFNVLGYQAPPRAAAGNLRGARLWGNVNPMLMLNGSKAEVMRACLDCLEAMAPGGGFMLGDGANACPGAPLENLVVFTEAAEAYGMPAEMSNAGE